MGDAPADFGNIFRESVSAAAGEVVEVLHRWPGGVVERIVSQGQVTDWLAPETGEWVLLLSGCGRILFAEPPREMTLHPGDYLFIPAGCRHRVSWTDPDRRSVWLAIHWNPREGV